MSWESIDVSTGHVGVSDAVAFNVPEVVEYMYSRLSGLNCVMSNDRNLQTHRLWNEDGMKCGMVICINLPDVESSKRIRVWNTEVRQLDFYDLPTLRVAYKYVTAWSVSVQDEDDRKVLKECQKYLERWIDLLTKKT